MCFLGIQYWGVHMDISWKYHINYHIIEWTFWDLLIISVDTPPLINYVANLVQYHRLSKCQFFVVQNWGAFFFCWLGFNPQMFSRVEGLESCSPYLWASPKIVGLDHSLSTEKVLWKTLPKWGNIRQDPSVEKGAMSVPITIIHRSEIHYVWENIPIYTC